MKSSFTAQQMVDTHKDAKKSPKHGSKSEMLINPDTVINALESQGFTNRAYNEQGYERVANSRKDQGFYTVDFTSNQHKGIGLCMVNANDGQSSMKLFAGVIIGDRVFPMVQVSEIKHRQHDSSKIESFSDTIGDQLERAINQVSETLNKLASVTLSPVQAAMMFSGLADVRRSHRNYGVTRKMMIQFTNETTAKNVLFLALATFADVTWIRHFVTLSLGISGRAGE